MNPTPAVKAITNGSAHDRGDLQKKVPSKKVSVEKIYQKKSQLEHILLRPDTYIGSVEPLKDIMWVYDSEKAAMEQREITYVPGLYKIFDEILVNAADNKQRDPKMDCIQVEIDPENNSISIWNNGKGIPVVEHKDEKMYVPTMIFGHLLTSSNYNDEEEKVTGGRNGYGAKLCNIFSTKFTVETASKEYKRSYKQVWGNNMSKASDPKIKDFFGEDYTKVTFSPDLAKFKMETLEKDTVDLMSRRAYDIAASTKGVKVHLNGKKLPVKNFKDYCELYLKGKEDDNGDPLKIVYEECNPRWEVAVAISDRGFQQVSFVNSIATTKGGRHVDWIADMIVKQIIETIRKKNKGGIQLKPFQVKNHMWVFVNCLIVNPTFDSQTKENMTLQVKSFGSKCSLSDKFIANLIKNCGIMEAVLQWARFKAQSQLNKVGGKKQNKLKGIPKLEDANDAGTQRSLDCTLILTEGDSAKSLAVSGLGVVGRDKYGVFPLRGKLLNVREASHKQILENAEINAIIKILGLQYKKKYESVDDLKTLRYGRLMIMTDQDQDGSHIKGLLINFIHHNWPTLLKLPFLEEFITPIVKATKAKEELSFYSLPEFEEWKSTKDNWHTYKIKYYKGLGTSTSKEAKEYFSDMSRHRIKFKYAGPQDDANITMAFSKKCIDDRKVWLTNWMEDTKRRHEMGLAEQYLYEKDTKQVNYSDFVNKELVLFSNMDNERSIPSAVDGLKPGQRKVMYTCLKRNDKREIKVAQLAGSVAEHSAYHHGEQSLMSTIINLAQNFVGSNNINLLQPIGQFGTRLIGGKDAASPRYIFTQLSPLTKLIFHPHDEPLLKHQYDDNQKIEPLWYMPVIPMILVNGADGIGTGWMTKIPNFNPREIIANIKRMLEGEDPIPMKPWYKNFKGTIEEINPQKFAAYGEVAIINESQVEITELPVGTWTQTYKENVLEPLLHGVNEKSPPQINDYKEYNTDTTVRFLISMSDDKLSKAEDEGLHKFFKLTAILSLSSMCVFDDMGCMRRFDSVADILKEFYKLRLLYYDKRKAYLEGMLKAESMKLSNQARFILEKCSMELVVENKKKKVMIAELKKRGYDVDPVRAWKLSQNKEEVLDAGMAEQQEQEAETSQTEEEDDKEITGQYDYLLGMTMWTLTLEKKEELLRKRDEKLQELQTLQAKTPSRLWDDDLNALLEELEKVEAKEVEEENSTKGMKSKKGAALPKGRKVTASGSETLKSPHGRRVAPMVDDELRKKYDKVAVATKAKRGKKTKEVEEKDEFDILGDIPTKSLAERLGNSPEQLEKKMATKKKETKQTRAPRTKKDPAKKIDSPKKKGRKKPSWESGSSDEVNSSDDENGGEAVSLPVRSTTRRAAAPKKYSFGDSDNQDDDDEDLELHDNKVDGDDFRPEVATELDDEAPAKKKTIDVSDTDSEFDVPKNKKKITKVLNTSDAMFDNLVGSGSGGSVEAPVEVSSDEDLFSNKKAGPKKRMLYKIDKEANVQKPKKTLPKRAPKKRVYMEDSEDEEEDIVPKKSRGGKKVESSDEEFTIEDSDF